MTFEERAKLKEELAGLSVGALEQYKKMFIRLHNVNWTTSSLDLVTGMLNVVDELLEEQNEQPEIKDV